MKKSNIIAIIPVLFAIEGVFLVIYGFVTGVSVVDIVSAFISVNSPLGVKDVYVIIGLLRAMISIEGVKARVKTSVDARAKRATMIVVGIFFVFCSIAGIGYSILDSGITACNVYSIVIEFIVTFGLSLFYLIYAFKQDKGELLG